MFAFFKRSLPLLLGGLALTLALSGISLYQERRDEAARTRVLLLAEIEGIEERISLIEANMRAVAAFVSSSPQFDRPELTRFLAGLHSPVEHLHWAWAERV